VEKGDSVNRNRECENIPEGEINLYDYWKVLVKRKTVFIGIFVLPLVIVAAVSLLPPRYYRGESDIINPAIPPQTIVSLLGYFDDSKKEEVFTSTPGAIKSVTMSIPKTANDRINIILESNADNVIPQAFQDLYHYVRNLRQYREEIVKLNRKIDTQLEGLIEAKKANLIFLGQLKDLIKNGKVSYIGINPADLIKKDSDLSIEIMNLQREKAITSTRGSLGPISITAMPSNATIKQNLIFTGIASLVTAIFVVFFLEYLDRMKARERK
jgi:hypothetical protein